MEINKLENIIVDLPIYTPVKINFRQTNGLITENGKQLLKVLFGSKKVHLMCVHCDKEYPFDVKHSIQYYIFKKDNYFFKTVLDTNAYCSVDDERLLTSASYAPERDEMIINYFLTCNMNNKHYYVVSLLYQLSGSVLSITKIGQNPITRDLNRHYSSEYKSILNKYNSLDDFKKFEQSQERGLLAGACTYLRRIFEKIVFKMLDDAKLEGKDISKAIHFDEKIKLVKDKFDPEITPVLEESYDLLSKGIHQLSDEQIDEFDSLMQEVIVVQLEYEKAKDTRINKLKELRKNIHEEHQKNK